FQRVVARDDGLHPLVHQQPGEQREGTRLGQFARHACASAVLTANCPSYIGCILCERLWGHWPRLSARFMLSSTTCAVTTSLPTLTVVRAMSRIRSTPMMMPMPSAGTPKVASSPAIIGNEPPGMPDTATALSTDSSIMMICEPRLRSTP